MNGTMENGILKIALSGHIDSGNAPAVEAELMALREGTPHQGLLLDLRELSYISSAGLRVVLRLRKLEPTLRLVNVSAEVYEIFDMTGFVEMMPVEKARHTLSVEGCEIIGRGANGTVYRIDKDTVVKVYHSADYLPDVQRERELARKAFVLGIPTAIPYDVVRVGESYGSVFELLNSRSFSKLIAADPDGMDTYVELYVDLMQKMHSTHVKPGDMPEMKAVALDWACFLRTTCPRSRRRSWWPWWRGCRSGTPCSTATTTPTTSSCRTTRSSSSTWTPSVWATPSLSWPPCTWPSWPSASWTTTSRCIS